MEEASKKLEEELKKFGWRLADEAVYCSFYCEKITANPDKEEKMAFCREMEKILKSIGIARLNMVPMNY